MSDLLVRKHALELRETWQAKALAGTTGKLFAVLNAIMVNNHPEAMPMLWRVVFPGFSDIALPLFTGYATIVKTGHVVCDMFDRSAYRVRNAVAYDSEADMMKEFRDLADRLKLSDADRLDMTKALKAWVVADLRINHLGEKVA